MLRALQSGLVGGFGDISRSNESAFCHHLSLLTPMRRQIALLLRTSLRAGEAGGSVNTTTAATSLAIRRGYADDANLLKTPLYDFHVEHGGNHNALLFCFYSVTN